ncbi:protein of unknown function [Methylorubrum extorquens]|uniref:Uncharacterized protein n=1 Tax=Methylorubrum extorquens TaxID=408 RepID=A0A2N9AXP3_METEX|nr:protein of unknown function [Methylorubrum extorquens]
MKTLLIASAAFAAMILTGVTADARGGRGGGGVRGGGGFHGGGFQVGRAGGCSRRISRWGGWGVSWRVRPLRLPPRNRRRRYRCWSGWSCRLRSEQ